MTYINMEDKCSAECWEYYMQISEAHQAMQGCIDLSCWKQAINYAETIKSLGENMVKSIEDARNKR